MFVGLTEMLILSLELVKNRMGAMHGDLRRVFLNLFTSLIEKSPVSFMFLNVRLFDACSLTYEACIIYHALRKCLLV